MTSFLAELRKEIPPLFAPGLGLPRSPLVQEVERLDRLFGQVAADPPLREDIFSAVKLAFQQGPDGVAALPAGRLAYAPFVCLYGERIGRSDRTVVAAYLAKLESTGQRAAVRRAWTHYLLTLEPDDTASRMIAAWLALRVDVLPERLRLFTGSYNALDPANAPQRMAIAALEGEGFIEDVVALGISVERLRTSALLVSILGAIGRLLREGAQPPNLIHHISALVGGETGNVLDRAEVREELRKRALASIIEGLVVWQRRTDPNDSKPEPIVDLLLSINGDPRFDEGRWNGIVNRGATDVVEGWLTRKTIEAFFRVISALNVERGDMWRERREFWLSYLPFIERSWLIVGAAAVALASREGIRYGSFSRGARRDHCGLMLEIDGLCVLEMNFTGQAILWKKNEVPDGVFPEVYDDRTSLNRNRVISYVERGEVWKNGCIGLAHHSRWQAKFKSYIQQNTTRGIVPAPQFRSR